MRQATGAQHDMQTTRGVQHMVWLCTRVQQVPPRFFSERLVTITRHVHCRRRL
jgi:hypothetical protein